MVRIAAVADRVRRAGVMRRRALTAVLAIVAAAAGSPTGQAATPAPTESVAAIGGAFTLVDQDGRAVTDESYRGRWLLLYFGYTHCPDACPTALGNMTAAVDLLDAGARAKLQPVFVTIDPERDTPAVLKDYLAAFEGAGIIGLSGTPEQVAAIEAAYRIHTQRHDEGDGEYSVSHTSFIYIIDPAGRFAGLVSDLMRPERLATRLGQMLK